METTRTVDRRDGAFAADLACDVGGKRYRKRSWNLRQEGAIHIVIRNPHQLAILVVEGPQNVDDIHHLAALINKFAGQRRSRRRIQFLVLDGDHRVRRRRNQ